MSTVSQTIDWNFSQPKVNKITTAHVDTMQALLNEGNRGGAYMFYYMLTGNTQALVQAQITTYSGFFGGAALYGNYLAKIANPDKYTLSLDQFSIDIVQANIDAIRIDINGGNNGLLSPEDLQVADYGVWVDKEMGDYFPGNLLAPGGSISLLFTAGSANGLVGGRQGVLFGNYLSSFESDNYLIQGKGDPQSKQIIAYDKLTGQMVGIWAKPGTHSDSWEDQMANVGISATHDIYTTESPSDYANNGGGILKIYVQADQASHPDYDLKTGMAYDSSLQDPGEEGRPFAERDGVSIETVLGSDRISWLGVALAETVSDLASGVGGVYDNAKSALLSFFGNDNAEISVDGNGQVIIEGSVQEGKIDKTVRINSSDDALTVSAEAKINNGENTGVISETLVENSEGSTHSKSSIQKTVKDGKTILTITTDLEGENVSTVVISKDENGNSDVSVALGGLSDEENNQLNKNFDKIIDPSLILSLTSKNIPAHLRLYLSTPDVAALYPELLNEVESGQRLIPVLSADGEVVGGQVVGSFGTKYAESYTDPDGNEISNVFLGGQNANLYIQPDAIISTRNGRVDVLSPSEDSDGNVTYQPVGFYGNQFGSGFGQLMGLNGSEWEQRVYPILFGTVGASLEQFTVATINGRKMDEARKKVFSDFGADLTDAGKGAVKGYIGSVVTASVMRVLDIDDDPETADAFSSLVGPYIGAGVSTAIDLIAEAATAGDAAAATAEAGAAVAEGSEAANAAEGINPWAIVGGFIGRKLGQQAYATETQEGAITGQTGAAAGAYYGAAAGAWAGPVGILIGAVVGAFVGYVTGGWLGDKFGTPPRATAEVTYNYDTHVFEITNTSSKGGGNKDLARQLANSAADMLNGVLETIGGEVVNAGLVHGGTYGHYKSKLTYAAPGNSRRKFSDAGDIFGHGITNAIAGLEIAGGDVFQKRALYKTVEQLALPGAVSEFLN
ncbi:MAG: hypothetical protein ACI910_000684, partial [Oleispira sp.]